MLASVAWLRALCPVEAGADAIADTLTARGLTVDTVESHGDDTALEIDVPANRPDCLGHLGLARELSAAFGVPLASPSRPSEGAGPPAAESASVTVEAPDLCARYVARVVRGVRVGPSPARVVARLEACGLRSINNVVDASNLVLLETGNPIHFFDLARVRDAAIVVRRARAGERLTTLDDVERILDADTLVIADPSAPVALAGVMGGADSEISASTTDVLIEAAWFLPASIRRTSRRLGLSTDASQRFERGVDPAGPPRAADLAVALLETLAGGTAAPGAIDAHPRPWSPTGLELRLGQLPRLLGYRPDTDAVAAAFDALGLRPELRDGDRIAVTVPSWRVDLEREADLVEEAARHIGYGAIPATPSALPEAVLSGPEAALEERARDVLASLGFHEALNYSMVAADEDAPFLLDGAPPAIALSNPIADSLSHLRRSVLPGLLRSLEHNTRRGLEDVRLFEVGRAFLAGDDAFPAEPVRLGVAWCGAGRPRHFSEPDRAADLHDLVGLVDGAIDALAPGFETARAPGAPAAFHPGRSATWRTPDGRLVAVGGELAPRPGGDLPDGVLLAEIELGPLATRPAEVARFRPIPRLTPVSRDVALVTTPDVAFAEVRRVALAVEAPAPVTIAAVDRYVGPPLGPGEASLTVRATLSPDERTLTEDEIEAWRLRLVDAWRRELGLGIRG